MGGYFWSRHVFSSRSILIIYFEKFLKAKMRGVISPPKPTREIRKKNKVKRCRFRSTFFFVATQILIKTQKIFLSFFFKCIN